MRLSLALHLPKPLAEHLGLTEPLRQSTEAATPVGRVAKRTRHLSTPRHAVVPGPTPAQAPRRTPRPHGAAAPIHRSRNPRRAGREADPPSRGRNSLDTNRPNDRLMKPASKPRALLRSIGRDQRALAQRPDPRNGMGHRRGGSGGPTPDRPGRRGVRTALSNGISRHRRNAEIDRSLGIAHNPPPVNRNRPALPILAVRKR